MFTYPIKKNVVFNTFPHCPIYAGLVFPTKPSSDPFYNPRKVLKMLPLVIFCNPGQHPNLSLVGSPLKIQNSWQLLVRSEDSFGNPNVIVTTVIEPVNADPSKIASYQVLKMQLKLIVLLPMLFNLVLI